MKLNPNSIYSDRTKQPRSFGEKKPDRTKAEHVVGYPRSVIKNAIPAPYMFKESK